MYPSIRIETTLIRPSDSSGGSLFAKMPDG